MLIPSFRHASYSAGGTIRATGMWRLVGRRYCPSVKISTPAFSMSRIVCRTSASSSPWPSMIDVFVTSFGATFFACSSTASDSG